jgi:carboxyl-terminal processing protease
VLVNRYSASASEIVAACLQDHGRAVVIGERTWGKGSVQNVIELHGGRSALKLTTASYLRPSGKNIHRFPDAKDEDVWGVMPNDGYTLKLSDEELGTLMRDRQQRELVVSRRAPDPAFQGAPPEPLEIAAAPGAGVVDRQMRKALNHLNKQLARSE